MTTTNPTQAPPSYPPDRTSPAVRRRPGPAVNNLLRAAIRLDLDAVVGTVSAWIADRGLLVTWDLLVRPVWTQLGRPHDSNPVSFMAERLFSQSMTGVLASVRRPHARTPVEVVAACAEKEEHVLPLDVLATALAETGIGACTLGAWVPPKALNDATGRLSPAVAVIWSQSQDTAEPSQVISLQRTYPACVVIPAGPGWNSKELTTLAVPLTSVAATLAVTRAMLGRNAFDSR